MGGATKWLRKGAAGTDIVVETPPQRNDRQGGLTVAAGFNQIEFNQPTDDPDPI